MKKLGSEQTGQRNNSVTLATHPEFHGDTLSGFQIPGFRPPWPPSYTLMRVDLSRGNSHLPLPKMRALMAPSTSDGGRLRQGQDKKLVGHSDPSQMRNQEARVTLMRLALLAENEFKVSQKAN